MNFNLNVKKEIPVDPKMAKAVAKGDMFVAGKGKNQRVFIIAVNPACTRKYLVEISTLELVRELNYSVSRQTAKTDFALVFGAGDYIAVEDIKDKEVDMTVTLK